MNIYFESKSVYGDNDKYIKTKIEIYGDGIITDFHNKKIPQENSPCKCLSIIILNSVIKVNEKYYAETLLEECKYIKEKIKTENYIDDDLKSENKSDNISDE